MLATDSTLQQLALCGGSPNGARPKVLVQYETTTGHVSTDKAAIGKAWLVKFQARGESKEERLFKTLYAALAAECGMDIPATKDFDLTPKLAGFGIERFDRKRGMRVRT